MRTRWRINEIFRSRQGEGARAGTDNVFVRFAGCNLRCAVDAGPKSPGGFDCDTEFLSGRWFDAVDLASALEKIGGDCDSVILTGGEPMLQVDEALVLTLQGMDYQVAMETNGTLAVPECVDWVTVSPKVAEHAIRQRTADEVKYVRGLYQAIPRTVVTAAHYYISPAFAGNDLDEEVMAWCKQLVEENPPWKLSTQRHKAWGIR